MYRVAQVDTKVVYSVVLKQTLDSLNDFWRMK